jgi:hypothetical protein
MSKLWPRVAADLRELNELARVALNPRKHTAGCIAMAGTRCRCYWTLQYETRPR